MRTRITSEHLDEVSQFLRLGLGLMLLVAGWDIFSGVLDNEVTVEEFWGALSLPLGLQGFLSPILFGDPTSIIFTPLNVLTVWGGLTISGGAFLLLGLLVRLFSVIFMIVYIFPWLIGLVVASSAFFNDGSAELMQASMMGGREFGVALLFLVLFNIGPGTNSLDFRFNLPGTVPPGVSWDAVAFQTRMSLAVLFLTAGISDVFLANPFYGPPWQLLLFLGVFITFGLYSRISGAVALLVIAWHLYIILNGVVGFNMALDVVAPEAPFIAAAVIFMLAGGGDTLKPRIKLTKTLWGQAK